MTIVIVYVTTKKKEVTVLKDTNEKLELSCVNEMENESSYKYKSHI